VRTVPVASFEAWRNAARGLLHERVPPEDVLWVEARAPQSTLPFAETGAEDSAGLADSAGRSADAVPRARVPRAFMTLAEVVACHRDVDKWRLLYRLLWRLQHETRDLLEIASDDDVHLLRQMAAQVRRDEHKMRAFVRFTPVATGEGPRYVAWYAPDHLIARRAAPFFADRFCSMRWSILTPDVAIHWDLSALTFTDGVATPPESSETGIEELWRTYYEAIFNPARLNLQATLREMPIKRWAALPEAARIPSMISRAHEQVVALGRRASSTSARAFVPEAAPVDELARAAAGCRGCAHYERATQVVLGEGP
jgi:DNA polymerase